MSVLQSNLKENVKEGWVSISKREASLRLSMFLDQDQAANRNRKTKKGRKERGTVLNIYTNWRLQDYMKSGSVGKYILSVCFHVFALVSNALCKMTVNMVHQHISVSPQTCICDLSQISTDHTCILSLRTPEVIKGNPKTCKKRFQTV